MEKAEFESFYRKMLPGLRSYLRVACGDRSLAEDLSQESFYRFLRSGLSELNEFQMRSYLYKTAASLVSERWRALKREARWRETRVPRNPSLSDPDLQGDLMRCFRQLKPKQQALLWMAYVEGFEHREISVALGVGEKSVRVLLDRSRRKLASILRRKGLSPEGMS